MPSSTGSWPRSTSCAEGGSSGECIEALRSFLRDRNNFVISKAAAAAATHGLKDLIPDLCAAFERFLRDPVKTDPQCWAKNAIARALAELGHEEPGLFVRGLGHVQMEPVWGGRADTAGPLRGWCAQALVSCRGIGDIELLRHLTGVLTDPDKTVRAAAALAIGQAGREEGALLLRLRALVGDADSEVIGAAFSALLSIEGSGAMPFVAGFLEHGGDAAEEAALALGLTHEPAAFELLRNRLEREAVPEVRRTLLTGVALTRLPEAFEFLLRMSAGGGSAGRMAAEAIRTTRAPEEILARLEEQESGDRSQKPEIRTPDF